MARNKCKGKKYNNLFSAWRVNMSKLMKKRMRKKRHINKKKNKEKSRVKEIEMRMKKIKEMNQMKIQETK